MLWTRPSARIAWLRRSRNKFWGGRRSFFMWIREGHGGTRNLSQSGSNKEGEDQKFRRIFRLQSKIETFFRPKTGDLQKKGLHPKNIIKSGVIPQKLRKYRWHTPIWASICTPVAPSLLISSGHSLRLGGYNFRLGGTSCHLGGHGPGIPPRGAWPALDFAGTDYPSEVFPSLCEYCLSLYKKN